MSSSLTRTRALALLALGVAGAACSNKPSADAQSDGANAAAAADDPQAIAIDAYIYGYPLITMDQTRRVMTNVAKAEATRAPMGQFANVPGYPDASYHDVTAPNANTLYSAAWVDLTSEPYVLSLPNENGRYYLMPMLSGWTDVFSVPGTRTTGTGAQRYLIVGPEWRAATSIPGAKVIRSPTNMVWIIGRTFAQQTPEDLKAVQALQRQYQLVPLSAFGTPYTPPAGRVDPSVDMKTPVRDQVNALDAANFFDRLAMLMKGNPPAAADSAMVARMASIGIVPGKPFDASKIPNVGAVLSDVPRMAQQRIVALKAKEPLVNGWTYATETGSYGTQYDLRAFVAYFGLGANLAADAIYPMTTVDASGQPLDGTRAYVLHFDKGSEPPVKGFWSVTMYDKQMFFAENPIHRYQISPKQAPVTYNADGSLDLYIQHESPGADKEKNWLPAPAGPFVLMMRMYWPDAPALNGSWKPPAVTPAATAVSQK